MQKHHIILLSFLFAVQSTCAQSLAEVQRQLDSMLNNPEKSKVEIGIGFGNNPAYGGKSTDPFRPLTMKPFLSPNLTYNHKSGWYVSAYAYYLFNATRNPWFEMDLNTGYDYTKRDIMTGVSYTRYFFKDSSDVPPTPVKNELYAYFVYRRWWLEPGVSVDMGWGKDELVSDAPGRRRETISGNDFNVTANIRHSFMYMDVLMRDDAVLFMPVFSFTAGTANYYSNLKTFQFVSRSKLIQKRNRRRIRQNEEIVSDKTGFQPRAVDLSLHASYVSGPFTVSPSYTVFKLLQGGDNGLMGFFTASVSLTL